MRSLQSEGLQVPQCQSRLLNGPSYATLSAIPVHCKDRSVADSGQRHYLGSFDALQRQLIGVDF